jgi:peptide/nickel transport system permease protein
MDSGIGKAGLFVVLFWLLTAICADLIITVSPLDQIAGMKNAAPGTAVPGVEGQYSRTWSWLSR